jgi:hypothetical protein
VSAPTRTSMNVIDMYIRQGNRLAADATHTTISRPNPSSKMMPNNHLKTTTVLASYGLSILSSRAISDSGIR